MGDATQTSAQLMAELNDLRQRVAELEQADAEGRSAIEALRESEQRYQQLVELSPDAVAVHCEGILVYVNQAGAALIGAHNPDELVGQPLLRFVHPDYRALVMERSRRTIIDQVSLPWAEEKFLRLDGSVFDVEVATLPFAHQGQPAVQVIVRDITERQRAAAALAQRAQRLALLNRIARAIGATLNLDDLLEIVYREVTQVLSAEVFFVALYDRTAQELDFRIRVDREVREPRERRRLRDGLTDSVVINKQPLIVRNFEQEKDHLPPVKVWGIKQPARSLLAVPMLLGETVVGVISVQSYQPHAFGDAELELLLTIADTVAVAVENARLYAAVQHYADDLEQRVAHRTQELTAAYERLQDLDRVKDEFVSRISHELRTPLANIQLYLGLLERGKPEKQGEYLLTLRRETDRLNKLIEDLLDLSHLDMGKTTFNISSFDLNQLVIDLLPDRVAQAAERGLTFDSHLASDLPSALADPNLTTQVMINLLSNALNYTPRGGSIECYTTQQPFDDRLWITFTVKDSGPGIGPDEQQRIFERFYRGKAARNYKVPGTGLGLAICKEIVDKLGGRITLHSQLGRGAAFTIWLPPA
jgi:PAS domain S-box-containing protein